LFGFCGLLALSILAVAITGLLGALTNTLTLMAREASQMVEEADRRLTTELTPIESQARFIAERFSDGRLNFGKPEPLTITLNTSRAAIPDLAGLLLINAKGTGYRILGDRRSDNAPALQIGNFEEIPGIADAIALAKKSTGSIWRRPAWIPEIQQTVINLHTPLYKDGKFIGLLIQGKAVADLSIQLRRLQDFAGKVPFLLYGNDQVLAHPGLAELRSEATASEPLPQLKSFQDAVLASFSHLDDVIFENFSEDKSIKMGRAAFAGQNYFFAYRTLQVSAADKPITVGLYVNEQRYNGVRDRLRLILLVGGGVMVISIFAALWMARATVRPIQALAEASLHVAAGNLKAVEALPRSRMRELDEAGQAFTGMVKGLKERERIMDLFGRVVPTAVAHRMLNSPEELAPQKVDATVLFCDLVGFTTLCEELGPDHLVQVLNAYFTDMVDIIQQQGGIVTQFQGDAILAVFNVPLADPGHPIKALAAARTMQAHLENHSYVGHSLAIRVGIATGPVIAANVGAASRMNYTVHGDTVNLAARLENLNKTYGTKIIVSAETAEQSDAPDLASLGLVDIRGQAEPTEVFGWGGTLKT
jgi:class 3 adenylate cyclase